MDFNHFADVVEPQLVTELGFAKSMRLFHALDQDNSNTLDIQELAYWRRMLKQTGGDIKVAARRAIIYLEKLEFKVNDQVEVRRYKKWVAARVIPMPVAMGSIGRMGEHVKVELSTGAQTIVDPSSVDFRLARRAPGGQQKTTVVQFTGKTWGLRPTKYPWRVKEVYGEAEHKGVQVGWMITKVDDQTVTAQNKDQLWENAMKVGGSHSITFTSLTDSES